MGTNRDAWVYNFSRAEHCSNVQRLASSYNDQLQPFTDYLETTGVAQANVKTVTDYLTLNPAANDVSKIKWTDTLQQRTISAHTS